MRGKASCLYFRVPLTGITPAYAGKSYRERYGHHQGRDHPRICGEKSTRKRRTDSTLGSPPHMRGKVLSFVFRLNRDGITPAYAGKSCRTIPHNTGKEDHPRICGEKKRTFLQWYLCRGSPPHMRGKGEFQGAVPAPSGITPAYAGKRLKRSRSTVPPVAIVPLFPSVCNKPVVSDGSPAGRDAPLFLPAENAVPASPAYNLRSL